MSQESKVLAPTFRAHLSRKGGHWQWAIRQPVATQPPGLPPVRSGTATTGQLAALEARAAITAPAPAVAA